ncbi:hypothetical protein LTR62_003604 [Meristemomyces frigidus]|uniref:Uncharacterized protein n=1 Tax=Meristemomyces frigidus TaxID=1508187 RepID=A0AAN7YGU4_9PEZI|nr:hypothetical protein LTR62_003604 [Meristemomyces frigidus]
MPAWTGWREADVRPVFPPTSGFTPINASASTADVSTRVTAVAPDPIITQGSGLDSKKPKLVESLMQNTSGARGNKTVPKPKKRANTDTRASKSKRQKAVDSTEDISIADNGTSSTRAASKPKMASSSRSARTTSKQPKDNNDNNVTQPAIASSANFRTSIYSPVTTIESVQSTALPTSICALTAASGLGATIYTGQATARPRKGASVADCLVPHSQVTTVTLTRSPKLCSIEECEDDLDLCFGKAVYCFDSRVEDRATQLPTPCTSDAPALPVARCQSIHRAKEAVIPDQIQTEDDFIMSDASDDNADTNEAPPRSPIPSARDRKQNMREVEHDEDYGGALLSDAERRLLHDMQISKQDTIKPVVRKPFPAPVLDRSPLFGVSNSGVLRTCFRIGEALNIGCKAIRERKNVLLELYARVVHSSHDQQPSRYQRFTIHDLYHDKPPHVEGTYALWDQSRLWELDSNVFLVSRPEGIMCRLIGRMKRTGQQWQLEILSIWEATWEDVESVASIYAKSGEEPWLEADT